MQEVIDMTTDELTATIERLEAAYRAGAPEVSDEVFDHVYLAQLRSRDAEHPLLTRIGAEADFGEGKVVHPSPMLSTDKVYSADDVLAFTQRVARAASDIGIDPESVVYELTPKLDGMAARYEEAQLVTRGDGLKGNAVTSAIAKGLVVTESGVGEIVMTTAYFDRHLAEDFKHPRNFVVGCISADTLKPESIAAFDAGAIQFITYKTLDRVEVLGGKALRDSIEQHCEGLEGACEFPTDGTVVAVLDERIRNHMGQTSSYHRWQCAKKSKGEMAETTVRSIEWTTGRTGRVTPTALLEPIELSGATIGRVTAHHAGNVKAKSIGVNAVLTIVRSGEVIPFIDGVVKPSEEVELPTECPTCNHGLDWEGDFLVCQSTDCDAQGIRRLQHYFEIIGNLDLFGEKTVKALFANGYTKLLSIYGMSAKDFEASGFGPKQSTNLVAELMRSRTDAVEDWRFLAAMGISRLGRGSSRRLLKQHPIETLNALSVKDIEAVESFGPIVAPSVHSALEALWPTISGLLDLGFNLVSSQAENDGPLKGKAMVFTGAMDKPRKEMEAEATKLGAEVQKSVRKTTDYLVTGKNVGATKINKAAALGVKVIAVDEYERLVSNG